MRKTKIVCTLGPATEKEGVLKEMIGAGMNVARLNFSHGNHGEHKRRLDQLKRLRQELNLPVAVMLDTKGPEIRLKTFERGSVMLRTGNEFLLTTEDVIGNETRVAITYQGLVSDVKPEDTILLDDGRVSLTVLETTGTGIRCRVENDGEIGSRKGVNVPGVRLKLPYLTEADRGDILFGIAQDVDYIAASFVRDAADLRELRGLLKQEGSKIQIIAKIESRESVEHLTEILDEADGIMIARGDMGVEIDFTEIPILQKEIIRQCLRQGKPVITATQMLESMIESPRPTRAEITDVANAIYDGTSAIMLSGETAAGKYPVEAVKTMAAIAVRTESDINYRKRMRELAWREPLSVTAATAYAACTMAVEVGADAILAVSREGQTARMVSRFRPQTSITAILTDEKIWRRAALYWGVQPLMMPCADQTDELVELAIDSARRAEVVQAGELVVVAAGVSAGVSGATNMIRICRAGEAFGRCET